LSIFACRESTRFCCDFFSEGVLPIDTTEDQLRNWIEDRFGKDTVAKDQIIDGKPWKGITLCYDNDESIVLYQEMGRLNDLQDTLQGRQSYHAALEKIGRTPSEKKSQQKRVDSLQAKIDKVQKKTQTQG
jgi:hypothetical protein